MYKTSATTVALFIFASLFQDALSMQRHNCAAFVTSPSRRVMMGTKCLPVVALRSAEAGAKADKEPEESEKTESGLPELKGDFDWDAKFKDDPDWITEDVPGKIVLDEVTLAKQVTALDQLETKWRKERLQQEYEDSKKVGFVGEAELLNGRFAMFFLVTGLLTELWTGYSIPQQVEEMLRIGGVIGFDG